MEAEEVMRALTSLTLLCEELSWHKDMCAAQEKFLSVGLEPETLHPKPGTLNLNPKSPNPKQETLHNKPENPEP